MINIMGKLEASNWNGVKTFADAVFVIREMRKDTGPTMWLERNLHTLVSDPLLHGVSTSLRMQLVEGTAFLMRETVEVSQRHDKFMAVCLLAILKPEVLMIEMLENPEVAKWLHEMEVFHS